MSNAQTWTVIGGFFAILAATGGLVLRVVQVEIQGLRNEMLARFDAVTAKLDALDRDVQRLYVHAFGREEPT